MFILVPELVDLKASGISLRSGPNASDGDGVSPHNVLADGPEQSVEDFGRRLVLLEEVAIIRLRVDRWSRHQGLSNWLKKVLIILAAVLTWARWSYEQQEARLSAA